MAVVGPTAAGKTELAVEIAQDIGGEIVSIDSTAIYRGMDIGTDKPSAALREKVAHHMIDIVDACETVSVAQFRDAARDAVAGIAARARVPILVGGSGLYFRAVVDALNFPPTDPVVRAGLEAAYAAGSDDGSAAAFRVLSAFDPEAAKRIHPSNRRRVIRALEVIELTGRKFSDFSATWEQRDSIYDLCAAGMERPRDEMDRLIDARVARQLESGLVDEVRALVAAGSRASLTSVQALGYAQVLDYLDGKISLEEAAEQIRRRTRRFARRQLTWFKADPRIRWFHPDSQEVRRFLSEKAGRRGDFPRALD